jgi:hypothetical protein
MARKYARRMRCDIRDGIRLEIADRKGDLAPRVIADMLNASLDRHRAMRALSPDYLLDGDSLAITWRVGRRIVGRVSFACDGESLPVRIWTKAVLRAYVCANSVAQIDESLAEWKPKAEGAGYVSEVVRLLEARDVLGAIAVMAEQKIEKGSS